MRALRFTEFGDPGVLHVADLPDLPGTAHEAVIRVEAASVNPSDVKNVAGAMDWTVLPRTPGRDFAGVVISGPPEWQGAAVWGTGGDTGFTRDGSHAELMSVPVEALVRKPERLSFDEASTVGVNFVVAWYGAVETAQLAAGETIAVFGVSGGVGGAVAQIARAIGAKVIGVDRRRPGSETAAAAVIDDFVAFDPTADVGAEIKRLTAGARRRRGVRRGGWRDHTGRAGRVGPAGQAGGDQRRRFACGRNRSIGPVPQRNSNPRRRQHKAHGRRLRASPAADGALLRIRRVPATSHRRHLFT